MTKKDYVIVANAINEVYRPIRKMIDESMPNTMRRVEGEYKAYVIMSLVDVMLREFPKDNPKFSWQHFKKAVYK